MHLLRNLSRAFGLILATLVLALPLAAQTPIKLVDGSNNELIIAKGGTRYTYYMTAMTTGATTVTSTATYVQLIWCFNSSAAAATLLVTDAQGSPVTFVPTVSIAANSAVLVHASAVGLYMQGIKITAGSNSAISCQVQGVQ